jgi:hypothetical protein
VAEVAQMVRRHKPKFAGNQITDWARKGNFETIPDPHYDSGHGKLLLPVASVEHVLLRTGGCGKTYSTHQVYQELKKKGLGIAPPKIVDLIKRRKIQGVIIPAKTSTNVLITEAGLKSLIKFLETGQD